MEGLIIKYFVLKPDGDDDYAHASREALKAYSEAIVLTNPQLANDLREWRMSIINPVEPQENK